MDSQLWHDYCTSDLPHEPQRLTVREWNSITDQQREDHIEDLSTWLANIFIPTDEVDAILKKIGEIEGTNSKTAPGAKKLPALTGPNYVGKSTMLMRWARDKYNAWTAGAELDTYGRPVIHPGPGIEADLCPVVWIDLRAAARIKDVDGEILNFFNLPSDADVRVVSTAAMRAAQRHKTRIVIIDDVHLLKTNWKGGRDVLDHVKHLNTRLGQIGVTLVLIGANLDDGDLANDPQIAARLRLQHFIPYEAGSVPEKRVWQVILRQLENLVLPHLPRGRPEMLFTKLAGELHHRTQGYLGDLTELVTEATIAAINDGTYKILLKHLNSVELSKRAEDQRHQQMAAAPPALVPT
jgi:hypothetical protein